MPTVAHGAWPFYIVCFFSSGVKQLLVSLKKLLLPLLCVVLLLIKNSIANKNADRKLLACCFPCRFWVKKKGHEKRPA